MRDIGIEDMVAANSMHRFLIGEPLGRVSSPAATGFRGGMLAGTSAIVKDDICVAGVACTAGSLALDGWVPAVDATAVRLLRESGVQIVGKANLSEWAGGRSPSQIRGWSAMGGQCRNAVDPDWTPGGSSAGSAVAVALGFADVGLGTETLGSVVSPASMNGIAALKPTRGMIPMDGMIPAASALGQTTIGLMARSVRELHPFYACVTAFAPGMANRRDGAIDPDEVTARASVPLAMSKVAVWRGLLDPADRGLDAAYAYIVSILNEAGVRTENVGLDLPDAEQRLMRDLLSFEFSKSFSEFLCGLPAGYVHSLEELVEFNKKHAAGTRGYDAQEWFEERAAVMVSPFGSAGTHNAARKRLETAGQRQIHDALTETGASVVVTITERPAWQLDAGMPEPGIPVSQVLPCVGGNPHLTIPGIRVRGRPIGVSLIGSLFDDSRLIEFGRWLEDRIGANLEY